MTANPETRPIQHHVMAATYQKNGLQLPTALHTFLAPPTFERVPGRLPEDLPVLQGRPQPPRQGLNPQAVPLRCDRSFHTRC